MRMALVSCGPTATRFDPHEPWDVVVAVNRTAEHISCDWWSAGDRITLRNCTPLPARDGGHPSVITMIARQTLEREGLATGAPRIIFPRDAKDQLERMNGGPGGGPGKGAIRYSATGALAIAPLLGLSAGDSVICFGCDMAGNTYFTGEQHNRLREKRWIAERACFQTSVDYVTRLGITVHRVLADAAVETFMPAAQEAAPA